MIGRVIGIDYGAKRVGIAVSDDAQLFAFAKEVWVNDDALVEKVAELAQREGAEKIVVGESDNPMGGENAIMHRIAIFSRALEVRTELPIEQMSEVYSSAEARRALETKVKTRKNKKVDVDAAAAAIILQSYLDRQRQELKESTNNE